MKSSVMENIGSSYLYNARIRLFAWIFLYEEFGTWRLQDIPEAMDFKTRPAEELWRTYFEKVRVHTAHSNNADSDRDIPVYRFGTVKVLEDDFLGVAAHFEAAIISAWEVPAHPSIQALIDFYD
ncbi:hypothetical protein A0H81_02777 [Grifola frondosa]|uniref:Uncharacterized protein n=1 Tax=Grifola frondosa TaxID=5627 RepID=A0A1C7MNZ1_GRIFR|nr:hypothetical protein A0H81_02777 [Grifola frondosa]